ncbi:cell division ATP-binding protein FtsE [Olsenella umbonata]|uniref:Cell division ATP-binding protein FtsE n=1 Tax=Parafannyhessea umbonata TaxID=604330 RepID=A0A7X9XZZ6_9ACTN|nr:cell division ATP-binding protein FtsE [Parafannyhessea umbonata]NMF25543.1 cell division ATP-binding protein FtsE [Parafannyhessea umbonata]
MANHFRSSERQGDDRLDSTSPQVPQADAVQGGGSHDDPQSHVDAIVREEAANARSAAAHAAPAAQTPADPAPQAPADAEPLQPVTTVTAHTTEDAPQAPQGEGLVVSQTAGDIESQPETKSVFAPLQDDGNRAVPHTGRPTISLRNATLIYPAQPNKPALDGVSLDIYPGEFVFVVGHSGSGKSTLLKLLTRELRATSGKVIVAGQDLTKLRDRKVPYLRRQIGTVYQDFKLLPDKTVYENVAFALECIGKPRAVIKVQVPETLRLVGLAEKMDNYPDQLSGGEQQRVSVARAMVNRPPLLVCDEPTGNLDPAISLGIMRLLDRINRTGTTVVMATHDREMVDSMRRRVIALEAGHVVRDQEKGGYGFYGAI